MSYFVKTLFNGETSEVKNLGWFRKNIRFVRAIQFRHKKGETEGTFIATLAIGNNNPTHEYISTNHELEVLKTVLWHSLYLRDMELEIVEE